MVFAIAKARLLLALGDGVAAVIHVRRGWPVWVGCAVAVVAVAGCDSDAGKTSGPSRSAGDAVAGKPSTTDSAPSRSAADAAGSAATAAYLGMWKDMETAGQTSDWQSPRLAAHATGDALSAISRGMYADHLNGLVSKGAPVDHPRVTSAVPSASPTTVMISDCGDSTHWLKYRKDSGKLADDKPGGRQAITAEVKLQPNGTWKVARFAVEAVGSC